jgi:hypothetical protein
MRSHTIQSYHLSAKPQSTSALDTQQTQLDSGESLWMMKIALNSAARNVTRHWSVALDEFFEHYF